MASRFGSGGNLKLIVWNNGDVHSVVWKTIVCHVQDAKVKRPDAPAEEAVPGQPHMFYHEYPDLRLECPRFAWCLGAGPQAVA